MVSAVSAKALLKFWIAVSVSAVMCFSLRRAPGSTTVRPAGSSVRQIAAPHAQVIRTRSSSTPVSNSPQYSCSRMKASRVVASEMVHRGQLPMICSRKPMHRRLKPRMAKRDCL